MASILSTAILRQRQPLLCRPLCAIQRGFVIGAKRMPIRPKQFVQKPQQRLQPFPHSYYNREGGRKQKPWPEWCKANQVAIVCAGFGIYYFSRLDTVPFSGRRHALLLPHWLMRLITHTMDQMIFDHLYQNLLPESDLAVQVVKHVGQKLTVANGIEDLEYYVIDDDQANAFVSGEGKVFVNRGLFSILSNEDQLAVVMGHEIAHYLAHHMEESLTLKLFIWTASFLVDPQSWSIPAGLSLFLDLPYSRRRELEADYIGLMLMAKACFDIEQPRVVWARFSSQQDEGETSAQKTLWKFTSTHPNSAARMRNFEEDGDWMKDARKFMKEHCAL